MNRQFLLTLWGSMFTACAVLGFIPESDGIGRAVLVLVALAFFVPPALLLWLCARTGDRATAALVRNLAAASLGLTCLLLVANFLSLFGSETLGRVLYVILVAVSTPMCCGQYWVMSLFAWACLLFAAGHVLKTTKTRT